MDNKKISPKRRERNNDYEAGRAPIALLNYNHEIKSNSSPPIEEAVKVAKDFQRRVIQLRKKYGLSK